MEAKVREIEIEGLSGTFLDIILKGSSKALYQELLSEDLVPEFTATAA